MRRWWTALLVLLMIPSVPAQFNDGEHGWTRTEFDFTTHDGITLKAAVWEPDGDGPFPVLLTTHGWPGQHDEGNTVTHAEHFASRGYIVYSWTARGFGESDGESTLNGPDEVADAIAMLDLATTHPKAMMDGPDDPRAGMVGISYGGAIQMLTAANLNVAGDDRLDVIVPFATWNNLVESLAPAGVIKLGWVNLLYASGVAETHGVPTDGAYLSPNTGGPMAKLHEWYATIMATNSINDEIQQELGVIRSIQNNTIDTPTLLIQGWPDTLFPVQDAVRNYQELTSRGVETRLVLYPGGHGVGGYTDWEEVNAIMDDFIDQHLYQADPVLPPFPVVRYHYGMDAFIGETQWPPSGTTSTLYYLTDDGLATSAGELSQELVVPPTPAQCTEISNFQGQSSSMCPYSTEGTSFTFTLDLAEETEVTGTPLALVHFETNLQQDAFLFFQLVEITADGDEIPVLHQISPWRGPVDAATGFVELPTITHTFAAGSQIGLKVSTTDVAYSGARESGTLTLKGDPAQPSVLLLPTVAPDMHGDRAAPLIAAMGNYIDWGPAANSSTELLEMMAFDDVGIANITATSDTMSLELAWQQREGSALRFAFNGTRTGCGPDLVTFSATDFFGKTGNRTVTIPACQDAFAPEPEDEEPPKETKESPLPMLLVPLALLAGALRRRR